MTSNPDRRPGGSLSGEVAIVTGGSYGIGRAVVELFAAEGADVVFCARGAEAGEEVERAVAEAGGSAAFCAGDVASEGDTEAVVDACRERFGPATVLVNNAGWTVNMDAVEMSVEEWEEVMAVDLRSAWLFAKHALPGMQSAGRGAIVNVSSIHAFATAKGYFPYAVAKAGLLGMTRSLALDYADSNVRVNAIAPGFVETPAVRARLDEGLAREEEIAAAIPVGRLGRPEEIAQVARFLASPESSFVTGTCLTADGGLTARRAS